MLSLLHLIFYFKARDIVSVGSLWFIGAEYCLTPFYLIFYVQTKRPCSGGPVVGLSVSSAVSWEWKWFRKMNDIEYFSLNKSTLFAPNNSIVINNGRQLPLNLPVWNGPMCCILIGWADQSLIQRTVVDMPNFKQDKSGTIPQLPFAVYKKFGPGYFHLL